MTIRQAVLFSSLVFVLALPASAQQQFGNQLDLKYFEAFVQPVFKDVCQTCHAGGNANASSRFPMQQSFGSPYTEEQTQRNFDEAKKRVVFKDPAKSLLILKPTAMVGHGGGQQVTPGGKDHKAFADWINGAIHTGPAPGAGGGALDLAFFEQSILPVLDKTCAVRACHGGTAGAGAVFHIEPSTAGKFSPDVTRANFEQVIKRVKPKDPAGSTLLRKPTGELPHGGGVRLEKGSAEHSAIVEWINGARTGGPGGLDRAFFEQFVNPIIGNTCALPACHGGTTGIGERFHLFPPAPNGRFDPNHIAANLFAVTNPARPRAVANDPNSLVLLKPSGSHPMGHGGGIRLARGSKEFQVFVAWVSGARARPNTAPTIATASTSILEQRVGAPATIDLSATRDREGDALTFEYKISTAPRGAQGKVQGNGPRATLTADRPGAYVITAVAHDGKPGGDSEPFEIAVILTGEAAPDDPMLVGPPTIPSAADTLPPDRMQVFVRRAYFDILGRGPTPEELTAALTMPRDRLVSTLFNRLDYHRHWLEEQYTHFGLVGPHRFPADVTGRVAIGLFNREFMQLGSLYSLVTSKQYLDRYFGTINPQNYLTIAFEQLMGRVPAEQDFQTNQGADLIASWMRSPEFNLRLANRIYQRYLVMECPRELAMQLAQRLSQFPAATVAIEQEIVLSADYLNALARPKSKTPGMMAESLIRELLHRAPTDSEFEAARSGFASSQDRATVALLIARALLKSDEAKLPDKPAMSDRQQWVRAQFPRFLHRPPTEKEASAFAEALNRPEITPQVIVEALISSQEYLVY